MGLLAWWRGLGRPPEAGSLPAADEDSGPPPDWSQRLRAALEGTLPDSWTQAIGAVPAPDGSLFVAEPDGMGDTPAVAVPAGTYQVRVTVARLFHDGGAVVDERVSHAFAMRGDRPVAAIEPLAGAAGRRGLNVDGGIGCFATPGVVATLAAERADGDEEWLRELLLADMLARNRDTWCWGRMATADGAGALAAFTTGYGDGSYPIHRLLDAVGGLVGLAVDCRVDNRRD